MNFSEKAYANKVAIISHTAIDVILLAFYVLEWAKGARTLSYIAVIAGFTVLPVAAEWIIFLKDRESQLIRHIMGTTYSLFYIFAIFTTNSAFTFVYAIPMYMVITLYMDVPYCVAIASGGFLANVFYVAREALTIGYSSAELPDMVIRLGCMLLAGIYMISVTSAIKKSNANSMAEIHGQQEKTSRLLSDVLTVSDNMITGIAEVTEKMALVRQSVEHIHGSMNEVSAGSNESAQSIQIQMQKTAQIQSHITRVKDTTGAMEQNVSGTAGLVEAGRCHMDELAAQVEKSMNANEQVLQKMQELKEYTVQMNTIIETITSITNSTGMLALNASIEAARAGEAGRGFAVVANQISGLANQTKSATVNITDLIENINKELESVAEAVDVVTESNRANADSTRVVQENFATITEGTKTIDMQTRELVDIVDRLEEANALIVENIQTVSAITEEVSAHASETYDACEENTRMVEKVTGIVHELSAGAEKLKNTR